MLVHVFKKHNMTVVMPPDIMIMHNLCTNQKIMLTVDITIYMHIIIMANLYKN